MIAAPSIVVFILVNSSPCMMAVNELPSGWVRTIRPCLAGEAEDMNASSIANMHIKDARKFIVLFVLPKDIVSLQKEFAYIHIFYENIKVSPPFFIECNVRVHGSDGSK